MTAIGLTEETPATPSWVEVRLDGLLPTLAPAVADAFRARRNAYLDCLAATGGGATDPETARGGCHARLLALLRLDGLAEADLRPLHEGLEALEAELAAGT